MFIEKYDVWRRMKWTGVYGDGISGFVLDHAVLLRWLIRVQSFYEETWRIEYLETAEIQRSGPNPNENNQQELKLEMTPVGIVKTLHNYVTILYIMFMFLDGV